MGLFYHRDGTPITGTTQEQAIEWAAECEAKRFVQWKYTWYAALVSTVFLGVNHNFFGGKPLIFETRVFRPRWMRRLGLTGEVFRMRHTTEQHAQEGHVRAFQTYNSWRGLWLCFFDGV